MTVSLRGVFYGAKTLKCKRIYRWNIFLWPHVQCQNVSMWFFPQTDRKTQRQGLDNSLTAWKAVVCQTACLLSPALSHSHRQKQKRWRTFVRLSKAQPERPHLGTDEHYFYSHSCPRCSVSPTVRWDWLCGEMGVEKMNAPAPQDPPKPPSWRQVIKKRGQRGLKKGAVALCRRLVFRGVTWALFGIETGLVEPSGPRRKGQRILDTCHWNIWLHLRADCLKTECL